MLWRCCTNTVVFCFFFVFGLFAVCVEEGCMRGKEQKKGAGFKMAPFFSLTYKWNSAVEKESVL